MGLLAFEQRELGVQSGEGEGEGDGDGGGSHGGQTCVLWGRDWGRDWGREIGGDRELVTRSKGQGCVCLHGRRLFVSAGASLAAAGRRGRARPGIGGLNIQLEI